VGGRLLAADGHAQGKSAEHLDVLVSIDPKSPATARFAWVEALIKY
jgi:hypothetical protein